MSSIDLSASLDPKKPEPLSILLTRLRADLAAQQGTAIQETRTVDHLLRSFGVRGFAFLLFLLPLLNLALFMVPGLSFLFGVPMLVFALQMLGGLRRPFFPAFLRQQKIPLETLDRGLDMGLRLLRLIEPYNKPRLPLIAGTPKGDRIHSVLAVLFSALVALPVPFLNLPPSLGAVVLSLGLIQRDGAFIIAGYVIGVLSLWLYISFGTMAHFLIV